MEGATVWFQIVIWSVLPIINTATFTTLFIYVVLRNKPLNNLSRILFMFTGAALLWSVLELHISWIPFVLPGDCIIFEPSALLENRHRSSGVMECWLPIIIDKCMDFNSILCQVET